MVQLAADGLFESTFAARDERGDKPGGALPERLAGSWLAIKQGLARGKIDDLTYRMLDAVDGDAHIPQATQRLEHLEMFVLLGDPALRLPVVSQDVELVLGERTPVARGSGAHGDGDRHGSGAGPAEGCPGTADAGTAGEQHAARP